MAAAIQRDADGAKLVRADFSDDGVWMAVRDDANEPNDAGYQANLTVLEDRDLDGLAGHDLKSAISRLYGEVESGILFVADAMTMSTPAHVVLVIDQSRWRRSLPFRALATTICDIEANVSIGNLDVADFAYGVDSDGTFRGFDRRPENRDPNRPTRPDRQLSEPQPVDLPERLQWAEERHARRFRGGPPADWQPTPPPIPREAAGRSLTTPEAWLVIVFGEVARPDRARAAGPFATYREALHFKKMITTGNSIGDIEVIRLEGGLIPEPFYQ